MPLQFPGRGSPSWFNAIEQAMHQDDVDIKRLWKNAPPVPNVNQGVPWMGPISPTSFSLPSTSPSSRSSRSSSSSSSSSLICAPCGGALPAQWTLTLSGISNNVCSACASLNATWVLDYAPGEPSNISGALPPLANYQANCRWSVITDICGTHATSGSGDYYTGRIKLFVYFDNKFYLYIGGRGAASIAGAYIQPATFNCSGPNVMTRISASNDCNGMPSTITLSPV